MLSSIYVSQIPYAFCLCVLLVGIGLGIFIKD